MRLWLGTIIYVEGFISMEDVCGSRFPLPFSFTVSLFSISRVREAKLKREFSTRERRVEMQGVLQCVKSICPELGSRSKVADQETDASSAKRVLEDSCQLAIPIWNPGGALIEGMDDLAEDGERLVDGGRFEHTSWVVPGKFVIFASGEVNQVDRTNEGYKGGGQSATIGEMGERSWRTCFPHRPCNVQAKNGMRPAGSVVEIGRTNRATFGGGGEDCIEVVDAREVHLK